jgi:hypothetical protein
MILSTYTRRTIFEHVLRHLGIVIFSCTFLILLTSCNGNIATSNANILLAKNFTFVEYDAEFTHYSARTLDLPSDSINEFVSVASFTSGDSYFAVLCNVLDRSSMETANIIRIYDQSSGKIFDFVINDFMENGSLGRFISVNSRGNVIVLAEYIDNISYKPITTLYEFDLNGELYRNPVVLDIPDEKFQSIDMTIDNDHIFIFGNDGNARNTVYIFDDNGNRKKMINEIEIFGGIYKCNNKLFIDCISANSDETRYMFYPIQTGSRKLGKPYDISDVLTDLSPFSCKGNLYAYNTQGIYLIDIDEMKITTILLWNNTEISLSDMAIISNIEICSNNSILLCQNIDDGNCGIQRLLLLNRQQTR